MSDEIVREFLVEGNENLDMLDGELIQLEKDPRNRATLASVFPPSFLACAPSTEKIQSSVAARATYLPLASLLLSSKVPLNGRGASGSVAARNDRACAKRRPRRKYFAWT